MACNTSHPDLVEGIARAQDIGLTVYWVSSYCGLGCYDVVCCTVFTKYVLTRLDSGNSNPAETMQEATLQKTSRCRMA